LDDANRKAPFDKNGECEKCGEALHSIRSSLTKDNYYKCAIRAAIFRDILRRKDNAYVAHSIVKATCSHVPLEFMSRFMEEVAEAGRNPKSEPWDREGPRVLCKEFVDKKAWFFTTWGAVQHLCSFEELDAIIKEEEVAFGQIRQPNVKGDVFVVLPPVYITWDSYPCSQDVDLTTVAITACTGVVSCHPKTTLHVTPVHPDDTSDNKTTLGRWPHLPFYNDWKLYVRWKCKHFLRMNQKDLVCGDILVKATRGEEWYASTPPTLVESRVPGPDFKVTRRGYLPYQHPALTQTSAGVATLKDHMEGMKRVQERKNRVDTHYQEDYEAWERRAYIVGKEVTERTCGTEERRRDNLALYGYSMDKDPRFNGEHAKHGYVGVGKDPCDPDNRRAWLSNVKLVGKAPVHPKDRKRKL
jgi:hypothetical protein